MCSVIRALEFPKEDENEETFPNVELSSTR